MISFYDFKEPWARNIHPKKHSSITSFCMRFSIMHQDPLSSAGADGKESFVMAFRSKKFNSQPNLLFDIFAPKKTISTFSFKWGSIFYRTFSDAKTSGVANISCPSYVPYKVTFWISDSITFTFSHLFFLFAF